MFSTSLPEDDFMKGRNVLESLRRKVEEDRTKWSEVKVKRIG
jgi:hypothetical protein